MTTTKKRIPVYLASDIEQRLREQAKREFASLSSVVNRALDKYLLRGK